MVQHIDRRLGLDDKETDDGADGDEQIPEPFSGQDVAQIAAGGHETHIGAGQEQDKADICIDQTNEDPDEVAFIQL